MSLALVFVYQLLALQAAAAPPPQVSAPDVVGVWKMCYEPGLAGVSEPSSGYLVLMPDRRYFEMRLDCCEDRKPTTRSGTYTLTGNTVVIPGWATLRLIPAANVVLFDDLKGAPRQLPVLAHERGLNYGFARVYPAP